MDIDLDIDGWTIAAVAAVAVAGFVLWRVFGKRGGALGKD